MTKQQKRLKVVFEKLLKDCDDEYFMEIFCNNFDTFLDDFLNDDMFGTEGQCDPRGDQRERTYNVFFVEGIDG